MNEMRAAQYDAYGPPEVLRVRTVPVPPLLPGHVLVRVAASSINGADTAVRAGKLKLVSGRGRRVGLCRRGPQARPLRRAG